MTILPPPKPEHVCPGTGRSSTPEREHAVGSLKQCPECGRWWKYHCLDTFLKFYGWRPVRWYDVEARRRIAAHETEKRCPIVGLDESGCVVTRTLRWWDCHPNPNRGRP